MGVRYFRVANGEFIDNESSVVRVGRVLVMDSPISKGRVVRVFEVLQAVRENPNNPLPVGALVALSFPSEHANADSYTWYKHGWEECQIPFTVEDRKANLEALERKRRTP